MTLLSSDRSKLEGRRGDEDSQPASRHRSWSRQPAASRFVLAIDEKSGYLVQPVPENLLAEEKAVKETTMMSEFREFRKANIGSKIVVNARRQAVHDRHDEQHEARREATPATFAVDDSLTRRRVTL